ncbi:P-loop NTPase fold protein [Alteromonas macleodii]|uniref:P-loop NTPase fold protein n=1 Tax=Alteromonas macleodii TaxID=28108 RepID=UPI000C780FFC|nr:P-loop NTPase fold protein [Alteromonas macleodii]AUI82878.1 hypothetical protein TE101_11510 [Alteromonas macleodii]
MTTDITKHDFKFKVLQEQVAAKDLFEEKTHENVASTLNELISSTEQGLTIGLEGGWGAGKSTVINLLKKKLSQSKTLFFVFDAWAHDGDPLRKIFLESLISSIDPEQKDKILNQLREKVSARKKTVNVKTKKSASKFGKLLSLFALLIPVGAALLSAVDYEKLIFPLGEGASGVHWPFSIGLLLSLAPVWLVVWWCFYGEKNEKGNRKWDFIESETEENYTQDITEDGERTSIEFEQFFKEILEYVFDPESKYRFEQAIIVIDNLDRVESDYAQNVWSTLQTFFQHRTSSLNHNGYKWQRGLWFLIPFDREGIQKVWQVDEAIDSTTNNKTKVADSFMEKCFQVTVEVPPPVMSAWIEYFKYCVNKALTGWPQNQKDEFIESYVQCMSKLDISPSPRQIHSHINRAGVLGLQRKGSVSAEAICIYSLSRHSLTENSFRNELLKDGVPNSFPSIGGTAHLKAELAGILFGVDKEKGVQLLLTPEIKEALTKGDGEKLEELEKVHQAAFWLAFRACSNEWMVSSSHTDEYKLNIINALYKAFGTSHNYIRPFANKIKDSFLESFDNWKLSEYSYKEALEQLLGLITDKRTFLSNLNVKMKNKLLRSVNEIESEKFPRQELDSLAEIEHILSKHGQPLKTQYYRKLNLNNWQKWLEQCKSMRANFESVLPSKETFSELVTSSGLNTVTPNGMIFDVLCETYHKYSDKDVWKDLPASLITWFNLPNRNYEAEKQYSLAISLLSSASANNVKALKECIKGAPFWQRAAHSNPTNNPSLPFLVALALPDFRANQHVSASIKSYLDSELNAEQVEQGYECFKSANDLMAIWNLARTDENIFARQILDTKSNKELYSIGAMYVDEIPWQEEKLALAIEKLCKYKAVKDIEESIKEAPQTYSKTIELLQKYGDIESKEFTTKLLNSLSREDWLAALKDNNELLRCVPEQSSPFSKAWADYWKLVVSGEIDEPDANSFDFLFELKDKVLDLESIQMPSITEKYFESASDDHLSDLGFELMSKYMISSMKNIAQKDYEMRLSNWIDTKCITRIEWFLKSDISATAEPTESIIASIKTKLTQSQDHEFDIYSKLNSKLNLGIDINALGKKSEEASEAVDES